MQITRQADYAVRAVLYLAQCGSNNRISTAEIGRQQHIPLTFLTKIMSQLSAAGIVHTMRGAHGGVRLGRPAAGISLLEIVEIIDGPMLLNICVADPNVCPLGETCSVCRVWCQAQADLVDHLSRTNVAQLVQPRGQPNAILGAARQAAELVATPEA